MTDSSIQTRNLFLVILWSYGLFVLMHFTRYLGAGIASLVCDADFVPILTGAYQDHQTTLVLGLTQFMIGIPWAFLVVRFLWRRSGHWMCTEFDFRKLTLGLATGFGLPVLIILIMLAAGSAAVVGYPGRLEFGGVVPALAGVVAMALFTGVAEELVYRGMLAREVALRYGWITAAVISGAFFGAAHLLNVEHLTFVTAIWITCSGVCYGVLLAVLYVRSCSLWLPIGFHAGWNISLKALVGTTESGFTSEYGLFQTVLKGHALVTGGEFGLEASVVTLAVCVLVALLILWQAKYVKADLLSRFSMSTNEATAL